MNTLKYTNLNQINIGGKSIINEGLVEKGS